MYFFNFKDFQIIGASPEILVRLRNNKVTIRPIAGTRPRGKNKKQDLFFEKDLLNDKKELSEHLMLLDLGRNDTGKVSKVNTVKVTESFSIERYSHVMHIVSNVEGVFNNKYSKFETKLSKNPIEIYKKLRKTNPSPFMYFFNFKDFQIIGASPEILVRLRNNKVTIRPIAGTLSLIHI